MSVRLGFRLTRPEAMIKQGNNKEVMVMGVTNNTEFNKRWDQWHVVRGV